MPAVTMTSQWPYALEPGLRAIWNEEMEEYRAMDVIPQLFGIERTNRKVNTSMGISGVSDLSERPEGAPLPMDSRDQLFKTTWTQRSFDKGIPITAEMQRYEEYGDIAREVKQLAMSMFRTRQQHAMDVFAEAFTATELGFDGVPLCSASHPYVPGGTPVQSNVGTTALSYDAVVATIKLMQRFKSSMSKALTVIPDTLIVPVELQDVAGTIRGSLLKPGVADNDNNFVRDQYQLKVIVSPYLSNAADWFLVDSRWARLHNMWVESDAPSVSIDAASATYRTDVFAGHMAYDLGWDDWRFIYGHNV